MPYPQDAPSGQGGNGIDDPEFPNIIRLLEQILHAEPDSADSAKLAKSIQDLYALVANREKEVDDAMAGKMSPRFMRKVSGGGV